MAEWTTTLARRAPLDDAAAQKMSPLPRGPGPAAGAELPSVPTHAPGAAPGAAPVDRDWRAPLEPLRRFLTPTSRDAQLVHPASKPSLEAYIHRRAIVSVDGIPVLTIYSYGAVDEAAVQHVAAVLQQQFSGCPRDALKMLAFCRSEFVIVGHGVKSGQLLGLRDIPRVAILPREEDANTRGFALAYPRPAISILCPPIAAVLNLKEYMLAASIHEAGHLVMRAGLLGLGRRRQGQLWRDIEDAYTAAKVEGLYHRDAYAMKNVDEYFACLTQAWFDAGWDEHTLSFPQGIFGVTSRKALKARDPRAAAIMAQVWGDGEWRHVPRPMTPWSLTGWLGARAEPAPVRLPPPLSTLQRLEHLPRPVLEDGAIAAARVGVGVCAAYAALCIFKSALRK